MVWIHSIYCCQPALQRIQACKAKGFVAVDPDNVDGYTNDPGFPLTADDQLDYNKFLAATAHSLDLSVGLKNDVGQLAELVDHFDFAVNEQCHVYSECRGYQDTFVKGESQRMQELLSI